MFYDQPQHGRLKMFEQNKKRAHSTTSRIVNFRLVIVKKFIV